MVNELHLCFQSRHYGFCEISGLRSGYDLNNT